jgi:hypothetical protein
MHQKRPLIFKSLSVTLLMALLALPALAEDRADRPQIAAATAEAVTDLLRQVRRTEIRSGITVEELLRRTGGTDDLNRVLSRAELIGGPRWIDADTCQIQLEISGSRVAHALEQIAANHPKESPLSAQDLARETEGWQHRTFGGTGSSTAFGRVAKIRAPGSGTGWASVSEADREKALAAAKAEAIAHVVESIKPIALGKGETVGDAMTHHQEVRSALYEWLENRPVTRVEYRRDMQLDLTMAGTPGGCFEVVRRAVTKASETSASRTETEWAAVREEFEKRMAAPHGRAEPPQAGTAPAVTHRRIILPPEPPDWVSRELEVEGIAEAGSGKLKAAREAESVARRSIAEKMGALPLSPGMTIDQAAEADPRFRDALSLTINKAKCKTDYNHHKGVGVVLRVNLRDLWDALRAAD